MAQFVESDLEQAIRKLAAITQTDQVKFALAKALTQTAKDVQAEVKKNMPGRFTIRRDWVLKGILITPATKQKLESTVYSRDKFMGLQEIGGTKSPLRHYLAIPTSLVKRTKTEVIKKSDRPAALGSKVEIVQIKGHKYLALKRTRKGASDNKLRLLYLLIPRAHLKKRLKLEEDGLRVCRSKFMPNYEAALEFAIRTAR